MKLRTKYILFVVILHTVTLVLSFFLFRENMILFIASEVFIIISIVLCVQLYIQLLRPLQTLVRGTNAIRDRDFNVKFLLTGTFEMDELITVYNAMMDDLRTERTKQEEQHFFLEKLIHTSPTGIMVLDFDENIYQVNPKALRILGLDEKEVIGISVHALAHPLIREIALLTSGEARVTAINGIETFKLQKSHFIDRGFVRYFIMIEEMTTEILAAEKKAYGKVIRMMAHEVNNTIGPVNSILESTLQMINPGDTLTNALHVAMERNNNLNIFMRNFADVVRLPMPDKKPVELNSLLIKVTELMQWRTTDKNIQFIHEYENDVIMINADARQMEQVLINIIKNAMESIEKEGTIALIAGAHPKQLVIRDDGKGLICLLYTS